METRLSCIDIGANLTHRSFRQDLSDVVYAARDAGVQSIVVTGTSVRSSQDAASVSANFPGSLYATAGVHPHDAKEFDDQTIRELAALAKQPQVVAIGECGLDYNRNFSPREQQLQCFESQLQLAVECRLPVFLHDRDAHDELLPLVRSYRDKLSAGVVHCFTGTTAQAHAYLDLDLHIGITGWICDERRGLGLRETVREIPSTRLMIETDSPYLAPRDLPTRVKRNEPKYLPHILHTLAQCRREPIEDLATSVLATTVRFFGIG